MKKFTLLFALGALLGSPGADAAVIYGYQTWEPMTSTPFRGPICFDSSSPSKPTHIADCSDMGVVYGGFYHNYRWYGQVVVQGTQSQVDGLYEIDMTTGERTLIAKGGSKMIDLTYDYSTNRVFGVRTGNQWLAEFDPATGESSLIGRFAENGTEVYMLAIAASLDGTLYGVGSDDNLYTVDTASAALTKVGALGVDAAFDQTMAFDYSDGTLYWVNNGDYTLYTVDTATGAATGVAPVGKNELSSMGSLFVPFINVAHGAPDRVKGANATGGVDSATLRWTNPEVTAQGAALDDFGGVIVMRDGVEIANLKRSSGDVGKADSFTDTGLEKGTDYRYCLVPYNTAGQGGVDSRELSVRVGNDRPGVVTNLKAVSGDSKAVISWEAPVVGANGGVFDPADITGYEISRGSKLTATVSPATLSYEDAPGFGIYTYSVVALSEAGKGDAASATPVTVKPADWILMTSGEERLESGRAYKFYDDGGPGSNYGNSRRQELVLSPADANGYIVAEFVKFDVETYGDYLSVYNGRGVADENLIGKFAATSVPGGLRHVESSADDGCLTFLFTSDVIESAAGWEAEVRSVLLESADMELNALKVQPLAVAGEQADYVVTVTNKGVKTAESFTVELLLDGNTVASAQGLNLASRASVQLTLPYSPGADGEALFTARVVMAGDVNASNNESDVVRQNVLPRGSAFIDLFAEEPVDIYVAPASFFGKESVSQILLTADEVKGGQSRALTDISFPLNAAEIDYKDVPLILWVGETSCSDLEAASIPASQLTEVYHKPTGIPAGTEALSFSFEPYEYKGGNLVIMLHKEVSETDNSGIKFRGEYAYDSGRKCTRYDSHYDTDTPFDLEESFGYMAQDMRPDIRLVFQPVNAGAEGVVDMNTDAPAVYYNLQGMRVDCPVHGNVYIERRGAVSRKVVY